MIKLAPDEPVASPYEYALERTVLRAVKTVPDFYEGRSGVVVLVAPASYKLTDYADVLERVVSCQVGDFQRVDGGVLFVGAGDNVSKIQSLFDRAFQRNRRIVILAETEQNLPDLIKVTADAIVALEPVGTKDLREACKATLGLKVTIKEARALLAHPSALLWAALRPDRSICEILERLSIVSRPVKRIQTEETPTLTEMHGYGLAKEWGLQLAQDLADWQNRKISWSDVDRGIVLSGPPGVGKTIFAKALAKECKATLVATSLAQWQARGHLGDLLKAMRADFARAKASAPAVFFIDELDSLGDRASFDDEHANYSTQVVNALLEALDGLEDREGVIVVAATNDTSRIDPAILRSGRLDKHVSIPLPHSGDRLQILRQLSLLPLEGGVAEQMMIRTKGMSGADLAKAVRDARRIARGASRELQPDDILSALPELVTLDAEHYRATAVHEAGHTVVGVLLELGEYLGTELYRHHLPSTQDLSCGVARFQFPLLMRRERQTYLDHIAVCLAGIAAEHVWLGGYGDGAQSDLAVATRLATLMETSLGFGAHLHVSQAASDEHMEQLRRGDPRLRARIERVLVEQFDRAKDLLDTHREVADVIIEELVKHARLTPCRIKELWQVTARR